VDGVETVRIGRIALGEEGSSRAMLSRWILEVTPEEGRSENHG